MLCDGVQDVQNCITCLPCILTTEMLQTWFDQSLKRMYNGFHRLAGLIMLRYYEDRVLEGLEIYR